MWHSFKQKLKQRKLTLSKFWGVWNPRIHNIEFILKVAEDGTWKRPRTENDLTTYPIMFIACRNVGIIVGPILDPQTTPKLTDTWMQNIDLQS